MSIGAQSSKSTPMDMTPPAFKNLQQPFADMIAGMLGFKKTGGGGASAGTGSASGAARPTAYGTTPGQQSRMQPIPGTGDIVSAGNFMGHGNVTTAAQQSGGGGMGQSSTYSVPKNHNPLAGIPTYQGDLVAPLGGNEQALLDDLMAQQGRGYGTQRDVLTGIAEGGENPFLQAAIDAAVRPLTQQLEETLSRTLPGRFTQAGQFVQPQGTSAFDRAAAIATRGTADAIADVGTNMAFQAYDADRNRQIEASRELTNVTQAELEGTLQNLQAQALPRLIQEYGIERGIEQFNNSMNALMILLQTAGGVTAPVIANQSKSSGFSLGLM